VKPRIVAMLGRLSWSRTWLVRGKKGGGNDAFKDKGEEAKQITGKI
jgi:hypothetical protein